MNTLLVTPPLIQMNSPYPATAYLTGYLRKKGFSVEQKDLSLDLLLRLFSREGLTIILRELKNSTKSLSDSAEFFLAAANDYKNAIEPTIRFLQGQDPSLAVRISERKLLPEGPRFLPLTQHKELLENFGTLGVQDRAKYLASLFLDDIADVIRTSIDPNFQFSRYGEQLASSQTSFDSLYELGRNPHGLMAKIMRNLINGYLEKIKPDLVGFTVPFPGNFLGALWSAKIIKELAPRTKIVIGGGFINTELRELTDKEYSSFLIILFMTMANSSLRS